MTIDDFLALSSVLTDFTEFQLQGTGQAELYYHTVTDIVGGQTVSELLKAYRSIEEEALHDPDLFRQRLRADILSDEKLGPIARNIIKLWYVGTWYQLPQAWRESFGVRDGDKDFIPSPTSYVEGLLWPAIGAHPPGAKAPGYGTWGDPPQITEAS
jgi:hypothetical protein